MGELILNTIQYLISMIVWTASVRYNLVVSHVFSVSPKGFLIVSPSVVMDIFMVSWGLCFPSLFLRKRRVFFFLGVVFCYFYKEFSGRKKQVCEANECFPQQKTPRNKERQPRGKTMRRNSGFGISPLFQNQYS